MIYTVKLTIGYRYAAPVAGAQHRLCLRPSRAWGQTVLSERLTIGPHPSSTHQEADFFDNQRDFIAFWGDHSHLDLHMEAQVGVSPPPTPENAPGLAHLAEQAMTSSDPSPQGPIYYLGPSRRIRPNSAIAAYAAPALAAGDNAHCALLSLSRAIQADFAYKPG